MTGQKITPPWVVAVSVTAVFVICGLGGCSSDASTAGVDKKAEAKGDPCLNAGTDGATATCLKPTKTAAYYAEQANKYFDTLDTAADPKSVPVYHAQVARWEWPPWLLLTGYGKDTMITTAEFLKKQDPSTVPKRDCRGFDTQPFARCYVVFEYESGPGGKGACPIYEEFTFNDKGEMTFIEAWSDLPGLMPDLSADKWAENTDIKRLATRVPGLGKPDGTIDLKGKWMTEAGKTDKDVAEFAKRAQDQWKYWAEELASADKHFFEKGCGWPIPKEK